MQAIIVASRSINQDKFFQKDLENKYEKHIKQIEHISKERHNSIYQFEHQVDSLTTTLRKAKSHAKLFRQKEDKEHLKRENLSLLKRVWNIEPSIKTNADDKFQFVSGSNWNLHRKRQEQIKQDNLMIGRKVLLQQIEVKDYKKKLKQEIKEYIELRDSIRKMKPLPRNKRSVSEKKKETIKLSKINPEKKAKKADSSLKESPQKQESSLPFVKPAPTR